MTSDDVIVNEDPKWTKAVLRNPFIVSLSTDLGNDLTLHTAEPYVIVSAPSFVLAFELKDKNRDLTFRDLIAYATEKAYEELKYRNEFDML